MKNIQLCQCDTVQCRKCLVSNCKDESCNTHTLIKKLRAKITVLEDLKNVFQEINKLIENGVSKEELEKLYNYRRLPSLKKDIELFELEINHLNKLLNT